jgi:hypothetical protein
MVSGSSDLANFTVLLKLTDNAFKVGGHFINTVSWPIASGNIVPADFAVDTSSSCNGSLGVSRPYFDIDTWNQTTGELDVWVLENPLTHAADLNLFACSGDASKTTYQGGSVGQAWVGYTAVIHGGDGTTVQVYDSSGTGNGCTLPGTTHNPTAIAGVIGGGMAFAFASSQYATSCGTQGSWGITGASATFTLQAIVNPTGANYYGPIVGAIGGSYGAEMEMVCSGGNCWCDFSAPGVANYGGSASTAAAVTHIIAITYSSGNVYGYLDGVPGTLITGASNPFTSSGTIGLGADLLGDHYDGWSDEIHGSGSVRSSDWLMTEARNQLHNSTYVTMGAQVLIAPANAIAITPILL